MVIFCSTIIATIARPSLNRAVQSLLNQDIQPNSHEIIVVNDSGSPLENPWKDQNIIRVISTNRQEKSIARNTGAAIARGRYLHFLDDDDFLHPGGLIALQELIENDQSVLYYGGSTLTDRRGNFLLNLFPKLSGNCFIQVIAGEWIPLGSYLVRTQTFQEVGGFNPDMTMGEDSDLCRRLALVGNFKGTDALVLQAEVGERGSSADYGLLSTQTRKAREKILNDPRAYHRMIDSANNRFWYGRIIRAYMTSSVWNMQHMKFSTTMRRVHLALRASVCSGKSMLHSDFWQAILTPYQSPGFIRGSG